MSCPGDLYVVPGANPCAGGGGGGAGVTSLQGLSGVLTLSSNNASININNNTQTDINIETAFNPQNTVTNSVSSPTNIPITAITSLTSQILATVQIITTATADINVTGNIVISTNSNTQHDFTYYIEMLFNGAITTIGLPCTSTQSGVGHFLTCPIIVNTTTPPGNATFYLRAYADTTSIFTVESSELTAIGNLTKTGGTQTTLALPTVTAGIVPLVGGNVFDCGPVTGLPTIDPALNPYVTFVITMCGVGTALSLAGNDISVGIIENLATPVADFNDNGTPPPSFNWGTTIPNALNKVVYERAVPYASYIGTLNYFAFLSFPQAFPPNYLIQSLAFQLTVIYNV
jgi:hypothetical protein